MAAAAVVAAVVVAAAVVCGRGVVVLLLGLRQRLHRQASRSTRLESTCCFGFKVQAAPDSNVLLGIENKRAHV